LKSERTQFADNPKNRKPVAVEAVKGFAEPPAENDLQGKPNSLRNEGAGKDRASSLQNAVGIVRRLVPLIRAGVGRRGVVLRRMAHVET
jgi:hypothetical protein